MCDIYRDEVLKKACEASFKKTAEKWGVKLLAVEFRPDQRPSFHRRLPEIQRLKASTVFQGRKLQRAAEESLEQGSEKEWGKALRSAGYFYESIGRVTLQWSLNFKLIFKSETIKHYIERQQGKHWATLDYDAHIQLKGQTKLGEFCN